MNRGLERRYRRWLRVYPPGYRAERGEEVLHTLLELSTPGQHRPAPREVAALVLQGLRGRAGSSGSVRPDSVWWSALPLAAVLMLLGSITTYAAPFLAPLAPRGTSTSADELAISGSVLLTAVLAVVMFHRHRYGAAAVLAAVPAALVTILLVAAPGSADGITPAGGALMAVRYGSPPVLLLPALWRGRPHAPRRWQVGVPVVLALPVLTSTLVGLLRSGRDVEAGSTTAMVLLWTVTVLAITAWGALIDGRVAIACGLVATEVLAERSLVITDRGEVPGVSWTSLGLLAAATLALLVAGGYRAHHQATA